MGWVAVQRMVREGLSWSGYERNSAFLNVGGPRFADVSAVSGLDYDDDARAVATVDWDFDGRLDLWLANRTGPRLRFMRNHAPSAGAFIAVSLNGRQCNRDAVGARLELFLKDASGPPLIRTLRAGEGYLAQSSKWVHFGFSKSAQIDRLVIRWPGGSSEEIRGISPNRRFRIVQGEGKATEWFPPAAAGELAIERLKNAPVSDRARIVVNSRPPVPPLTYTDMKGQPRSLTADGAPGLLVNLWASWCPNCLLELKSWAVEAETLKRSGIRIVALSVDKEPEAQQKAREILEEMSWAFESGFVSPETIDAFDIIQRVVLERDRPLPLPSTFLLDGRGNLVLIHKGPVSADALAADFRLIEADGGALRDAACPFPGTWVTTPPGPDYTGLADEFGQRGHPELASYILARANESSGAEGSRRMFGARLNVGVSLQREGRHAEAENLFRELLAQQPTNPEVLNNLGIALASLGRHEEAVAAYSDSLKQRAGHTDTMANLASSLRALGRREEAESACRQILAVYPSHVKALNDLGMLMAEQNRPDEAEALLRKAIEVDPGHVAATYNLAVLIGRRGQGEDAIALCQRIANLDPTHIQARIFLGVSCQRAGRLEDAAAAFEEALKIAPTHETAMYNLGIVHLARGDLAKAEAIIVRLESVNAARAEALRQEAAKLRARQNKN